MMVFFILKAISTSCFIHILLFDKFSKLTKFVAFTLAPFKRASLSPDKLPAAAVSIRLSF